MQSTTCSSPTTFILHFNSSHDNGIAGNELADKLVKQVTRKEQVHNTTHAPLAKQMGNWKYCDHAMFAE